jgi:hypothetical protein
MLLTWLTDGEGRYISRLPGCKIQLRTSEGPIEVLIRLASNHEPDHVGFRLAALFPDWLSAEAGILAAYTHFIRPYTECTNKALTTY